MTEPAHTPDPPRPPKSGRVAEVLMLITFAVVCAAAGGLLHLAAELPASTAALSALASMSVIVAINAMVRRKAAVNALNAQIAELRLEVSGLRNVRGAAPLGRPQMVVRPQPTPGLRSRSGEGPRMQPATSGPRGLRPAPPPPQARPPAPQPSGASTGAGEMIGPPAPVMRTSTPSVSAPSAKDDDPAQRSAGPLPTPKPGMDRAAMGWTLRPGVHREPTIRLPEDTAGGAPLRAAGPLPLMPGQPAVADRTDNPPLAPAAASKTANKVAEPHPGSAPRGSEGQPTQRKAARSASGGPLPAPPVSRSAPPVAAGTSTSQRSARSVAGEAAGPNSRNAAAPPPASAIDDLMIPPSDDAPRAMSRPNSTLWPRVIPRSPTAPLDLDTMQNLIEQLAGQLDQEPALPEGAAQGEGAPDVPVSESPVRAAPFRAQETSIPAPAVPSRSTPARAAPGGVASEREAAPFGHIALIAEAVEAKRMDVLLDPILGLADRRARHFELSVRLLTEKGDSLVEEQYVSAAAGTGLLGRIDAEKLARAADVLQRLRARGSAASLFSTVAGESLSDDNFASIFADVLEAEEDNASRLVLTFRQAEARNFTDAHWRAISDMSRFGLKFALTGVTDLDMDFEVLRRHGFDFVKLDARVFLEGLPTPTGVVPAADICRHMAGIGLGLIVGGIVEEKDLARILGFGVLLGQGALFGGPRSVELERERRAA